VGIAPEGEETILAGAAADVVGGAVTAKGAAPGVDAGLGAVGDGAAQAVSSATIASGARAQKRRFVTKLRANVAKPQKATLKFGISAAL
jgi:hypothetical protein